MSKILFVPNPKLRQKSEVIQKVTKKEIYIAKEMTRIMKEAPGVGLAANQIGILKKIVTVNIKDEQKGIDKNYTLFNPTIISYSKEKIIMEEGCLSIPKQYAEIERPSSIELEYTNENNEVLKNKLANIFHLRIEYPE